MKHDADVQGNKYMDVNAGILEKSFSCITPNLLGFACDYLPACAKLYLFAAQTS